MSVGKPRLISVQTGPEGSNPTTPILPASADIDALTRTRTGANRA